MKDSRYVRLKSRFKRIALVIFGAQIILFLLLYFTFSQTLNFVIDSKVFPYAKVMEVTAYTAGPESTGKTFEHPDFSKTASTYKINVGLGEKLVAAPADIKYGTRVYVPDYGVGPVKDRGEDIADNHLDVYFDDVNVAELWGRKTLTVIVFP
jgi:3D (Asp-Asp-Asp) domain-containing protein